MVSTPSSVQEFLDLDLVQSIVDATGQRLEARLAEPLIQPRGLTLQQAAAYCGVSHREFNALTRLGLMPAPAFRQGNKPAGHPIWDKAAIDAAFDRLSGLNTNARPSTVEEWRQRLPAHDG